MNDSRYQTPGPATRAAAKLDALLSLSRSLGDRAQEGLTSEALDLLLSATWHTRGAVFVHHDGALELVAHRALSDSLRLGIERLSLTEPAWFLAQDHAIMDSVNEVVRALDGSFSAEHGIGRLKPYMMPDWRGGAELQIMHRIKNALDPEGIMNPGKVLPGMNRH